MPKIVTASTSRGILTDANGFSGDVSFTSVYAGSTSKDASAIIQADSTSQGHLFPRMTEAQKGAIVSPATGLIIYNTDTSVLNIYDGASWSEVGGGGGSSSPIAMYTINTTSSGTISGVGVEIIWRDPTTSASLYDSGGFYQSGSPTRLLIPSDGVYEVIASISLVSPISFPTSATYSIECQRSSSFIKGASVGFQYGGVVAVVHGIFDLLANDEVLIKYTQTTSASHAGMDVNIKKL